MMSGSSFQGIVRTGLVAILVLAPSQYAFRVAGANLCPVDILVWLVFLRWVAGLVLARGGDRLRLPPMAAFLLVLAAAVSVAAAVDRKETFTKLFQWTEYFLVAFLLFANGADDRRGVRTMAYAFVGVATLVVAFGLVQYFDPQVDTFKVRATFGNRNVLGGYLAMVLPVAFAFFLYETRWPLRAGWIALVAAGFILNLAGGTLIALAVGLSAVALGRSRFAFVIVLAALVLGIAVVSPRMPRDNLRVQADSIGLFDEKGEMRPRYTEWQAAINMWQEHPLIGVGAGNYQLNIGSHYGYIPRPNTNVTEPDSHNLYLVLLSSTGLLGALAFAGMLIFFSQRAFAAFNVQEDRFCKALALGLAGGILAVAVNNVWSAVLVRGLGIPLAFMFGLVAVLDAKCREGG